MPFGPPRNRPGPANCSGATGLWLDHGRAGCDDRARPVVPWRCVIIAGRRKCASTRRTRRGGMARREARGTGWRPRAGRRGRGGPGPGRRGRGRRGSGPGRPGSGRRRRPRRRTGRGPGSARGTRVAPPRGCRAAGLARRAPRSRPRGRGCVRRRFPSRCRRSWGGCGGPDPGRPSPARDGQQPCLRRRASGEAAKAAEGAKVGLGSGRRPWRVGEVGEEALDVGLRRVDPLVEGTPIALAGGIARPVTRRRRTAVMIRNLAVTGTFGDPPSDPGRRSEECREGLRPGWTARRAGRRRLAPGRLRACRELSRRRLTSPRDGVRPAPPLRSSPRRLSSARWRPPVRAGGRGSRWPWWRSGSSAWRSRSCSAPTASKARRPRRRERRVEPGDRDRPADGGGAAPDGGGQLGAGRVRRGPAGAVGGRSDGGPGDAGAARDARSGRAGPGAAVDGAPRSPRPRRRTATGGHGRRRRLDGVRVHCGRPGGTAARAPSAARPTAGTRPERTAE